MRAYQAMTGRVPQALQQESGFLRSWGSDDGAVYVWRSLDGTHITPSQLESRNATAGRRRRSDEQSFVKSHGVGWRCHRHNTKCSVTRAVHLIRNPFDNAFSQFHAGKNVLTGKLVKGLSSKRASFMRFATAAMREYVRWHLSSLSIYRKVPTLVVHYDELLAQPSATFDRIVQFVQGTSQHYRPWQDVNPSGKGDRGHTSASESAMLNGTRGLPIYLLRQGSEFAEADVRTIIEAFVVAVSNASSIMAERVNWDSSGHATVLPS